MSGYASFLMLSVVMQWTDWTNGVGGNNHQYRAFAAPQGITWADAQTAAEAQGGYLVTLTSQAENDFVFNLIDFPEYWMTVPNETLSSGPWTGGIQLVGSPEPAGGWTWVTGETFSYNNWAVGEPNNINVLGEDRINYWAQQPGARDRLWNDLGRIRNEIVVSYVVERTIPEPGSETIPEPGSGTIFLTFAVTGCMVVYRTPKNQRRA